jgi:hypothetical protein
MTDKQLFKLALNALETCGEDEWHSDDDFGMVQIYNETMVNRAITALKERLAQETALQALHDENERLGLYRDAYGQPEQEPVGFVQQSVLDWLYSTHRFSSAHTITTIAKSPTETEDVAIYTTPPAHPPQRTEQEPVIDKSAAIRIATALGWTPPRTWVGLTLTQVKLLGEGVQEEAIKSGHSRDWVFYTHINEALKEKNT